jgi:hypothetical protein
MDAGKRLFHLRFIPAAIVLPDPLSGDPEVISVMCWGEHTMGGGELAISSLVPQHRGALLSAQPSCRTEPIRSTQDERMEEGARAGLKSLKKGLGRLLPPGDLRSGGLSLPTLRAGST